MLLVKQHIQKQGSLKIRSLKALLIGPSGTGKTTAKRRLTEELYHLESPHSVVPSTGIDKPLTVQLYHKTQQTSILIPGLAGEWKIEDLEEQCHTLCNFILHSLDSSTPSSSSSIASFPAKNPFTSRSTAAGSADPQVSKKSKWSWLPRFRKGKKSKENDDLLAALGSLVKNQDWQTIREKLKDIEDVTLLHIVDIGGQPECHEILPLLLHGRALNLIFLNLIQDLDSTYKVVFRDEEGPSPVQYQSEFTIREILQRALCSISSLQSGPQKPAALLVGTHLDQTNEEAVLALDKSIQEAFKEAEFMKRDLLCPASGMDDVKRYIYPLDNVTGGQEEIEGLHKLIMEIIEKRFPAEEIPTASLLFHLVLRSMFELSPGWCTLEECVDVAAKCGISKEDLLRKNGILQFIHKNFGTILHYLDVDGLKERVICDPNIILVPLTRLFVFSFACNPDERKTAEHIRLTGEIPTDLLERVCASPSPSPIPTSEIVALLKNRYILYENVRSSDGTTTYFMPSLLYPDHNVAKEANDPSILASLSPAPLLLVPSSGFVPLGLFPALVVKLSHSWVLDKTDRFRNRICFFVSRRGQRVRKVEVRTLSTFLECRLLPVEDPASQALSTDSHVLINCRQELWETLVHVSALYPHTQEVKWRFGFNCPGGLQPSGHPHPATCLTEYKPQDVVCSLSKCCQGSPFELQDKQKAWFMVSFNVL